MKNLKKILALVIVASVITVMGLTAFTLSAASSEKGSITIKNATKGYEYKAYKIFDATYTGSGTPSSGATVSYTTPSGTVSILSQDSGSSLFGWSTAADAEGNVGVWKLDSAADADVIAWIEEHYADFGATAITGVWDDTNSTVTFSNLDLGYYYITSGLGTIVTIDTAAPDAVVYDKNETSPEAPTKTIIEVDGTEVDDLAEADAHVGSTVKFKITAKTNNWIDKDTIRTEWEITDTPTNMDLDKSSVDILVNGAAPTGAYTVTKNDDGSLTINIKLTDDKGNSIYAANTLDTSGTSGTVYGLIPIEITYSATITKEAASAPAENEVSGSTVEVFTYGFRLAKVDEKGNPLSGAQFVLEYSGSNLKFITSGSKIYIYSPSGTTETLDLTEETIVSVLGLDNRWNYTLKETVVPAGYNQAEDESISGSWLYKIVSGTVIPDDLSNKEIKVINKSGSILPSTGGIGTTIFYVVGAVLVIGAGVVLVTRRRMGNAD